MSDLRHDPINDQWVAIAKNRIGRPTEFAPAEQLRQQIICPFCKGNEDETPTAILGYRTDGNLMGEQDDSDSWLVRVVPNKYPSFSNFIANGSEDKSSSANNSKPPAETGPHQACQHHGIQELIIPSSRHITSVSELTDDELQLTLKAAQTRIADLKKMDGIEHAMLFMNCRLAAGASLGHIHLQLIGSPVISRHLKSRVDRDDANRREHGCSLINTLVNWEIEQGDRIVALTDNFCVVCPFASRFAFQVRIIPRDPRIGFLEMESSLQTELAAHIKNLVTKFESQIEKPAYNLLLHLDPFKSDQGCWYIELLPRLTRGAGYELGTDVWVNPISPEFAARRLRF